MQDFEKEVVLELIQEDLLPALKPRMPEELVLTTDILFACETDGSITGDPALAFAELAKIMRSWTRKPTRKAGKKLVDVVEFQARAFQKMTPEMEALLEEFRAYFGIRKKSS